MSALHVDTESLGFPIGYFSIKSVATGRLLEVYRNETNDSSPLALWPAKEQFLVEALRSPDADNQVFFVDSTGALCSRASGHAIDIDGEELVLRHRRPISYPFPNEFSHPLPQFSYDKETQQISITFSYPPNFANSPQDWAENTYLLASKPRARPKSVIEQATAFFSTAVTSSKSMLSGVGHNKPTPDQVFDNGDIDLRDDEILDLDRSEEGEVDNSPDLLRLARVVTVSPTDYDKTVAPYKALRRRWELLPLRATRAQYHARKPSTSN
ncbi:hypothetical protein BDM02DRAFT_3110823 [Thelephora ganbajun]|uniref:Uncharacterized protein n=1 Tax=Thelephora ganbajun TaxID=370292 RepID=A0ACB6ZPC7_THEGA|nr:hypothetical protein BDM02DRAFT_3110823 [Thelephora ganbajun]